VHYFTDPDAIMESLHAFFQKTLLKWTRPGFLFGIDCVKQN
jgi:hypothetical protein